MIAALVRLWPLLSVAQRELLAAIFNACVALGITLAVPTAEGWDSPVLAIGADSSIEQVQAALQQYESLARRFNGLPLDLLFSRQELQADRWEQLLGRAGELGASDVRTAIEQLQSTIAEWNRSAGAIAPTIVDAEVRQWLSRRLSTLQQAPAPEGDGKGKWILLAILGASLLLGGRK